MKGSGGAETRVVGPFLPFKDCLAPAGAPGRQPWQSLDRPRWRRTRRCHRRSPRRRRGGRPAPRVTSTGNAWGAPELPVTGAPSSSTVTSTRPAGLDVAATITCSPALTCATRVCEGSICRSEATLALGSEYRLCGAPGRLRPRCRSPTSRRARPRCRSSTRASSAPLVVAKASVTTAVVPLPVSMIALPRFTPSRVLCVYLPVGGKYPTTQRSSPSQERRRLRRCTAPKVSPAPMTGVLPGSKVTSAPRTLDSRRSRPALRRTRGRSHGCPYSQSRPGRSRCPRRRSRRG